LWRNPSGPGHEAVIWPGKYSSKRGAYIAQAGTTRRKALLSVISSLLMPEKSIGFTIECQDENKKHK
jgi:hypothetical protein